METFLSANFPVTRLSRPSSSRRRCSGIAGIRRDIAEVSSRLVLSRRCESMPMTMQLGDVAFPACRPLCLFRLRGRVPRRLFTSNESRVIWWRTMNRQGRSDLPRDRVPNRDPILDAASNAPRRVTARRASPRKLRAPTNGRAKLVNSPQ